MTDDIINCQKCPPDSDECQTMYLEQSLGLPQECLEEPNLASTLVVPLVISADVLMVATLLLVLHHWLK
jgi:hypothetical protein